MLRLLFANSAFLAGMLALCIPILIHLLLKRKKKRLRFSTVQFFLQQDEQSNQRRKLRNLILLAMRLLLFALLVLAFARPYFPENGANSNVPHHLNSIFVLDASLSMQADGQGGSRWTAAKEMIRKNLADLKLDDRAALITCSSQAEVASQLAPASVVLKALDKLQPTFGTADIGDGLEQASKLLALTAKTDESTIVVVSDVQRTSCRNIGEHPLSKEAKVKLLNIGESLTSNLAITELKLEAEIGAKPRIAVENFADAESRGMKLACLVDGKEQSAPVLSLKAGAVTNVEFALPALKPGWHSLQIELNEKDSLRADNIRFQTLFIPQPVRALVVETRKPSRSFEAESFYITTALDPTDATTNRMQSSFAFETVSPETLIGRLSAQAGESPYGLVVLPGLKQIPAGVGVALLNYVQKGGGVMFFLGDGISPIRYNSEFLELLPAKLDTLGASAESQAGWHMGYYDTNSALFAAFRLPGSGNLALPEFTRRFTLLPDPAATTVASFEDGVPLILSRAVGKGRVLLANTSADANWTDWPKRKSFVPWLHGAGRHLAGSQFQGTFQTASTFVAGMETEIDLGPAAKGLTGSLVSPDGKAKSFTADDQGMLKDLDARAPGIYSLRASSGQELRRFAVNVPMEESDLAALSSNEFQQSLARLDEPKPVTLSASLFGPTDTQKELWRIFLLAALALLFIEMFWANRSLA